MSATTAHQVDRETLASKAVRALGWVVAAAWRSRWVPQEGEHPGWCDRPAEGCRGTHDRWWVTGRGYDNGSTWHIGAMLAIGADEDEAPRIVGALAQRESDWCYGGTGERASTGALIARLELSVEDARLFAYDMLRTVDAIEAGVPVDLEREREHDRQGER